jgi:MFS family permease
MQQIAVSWLVYRMTRSPALLGVVAFTGRVPTFLLAPLAGVLVDRWNRRSILIVTQALAMVQAFLLALLVVANTVAMWHIILLSIFLGCVNALDIPTRQAFVMDMVEKHEDVGNAVALNSVLVNGARLVGPSVAGILIAAVGEEACFLLNGMSFLAVLLALLAMQVVPRRIEKARKKVWPDLKEGFGYAFGFAPIRSLLFLMALGSLAGMPYIALMPVFAAKLSDGGPQALGFLLGSSGVGAMIGAIYLASRKTVLGLGRIVAGASGLFGLMLVLFSLSRTFSLSMLLMVFVGFGMMVQTASINTLLQTMVEEDKRGRVMSFYTMAFMGMVPFGSLLAGFLASLIGAPETVMFGGILCTLGAGLFGLRLPLLRSMVRPIYARKGIISGNETPNGLYHQG